jgi:hypothetical protein
MAQTSRKIGWRAIAVGVGLVALGSGFLIMTATGRELLLESETRKRYLRLKAIMAAKGIKLYTGSTKRTRGQQAALVAKGASAVKTASWHESGRAVDAYPIDPKTGKPDLQGKNEAAFRLMHQEWAKLGGTGLAYSPYPDGAKRYLATSKGKVWDGGHLEYRGGFPTALAALKASGSATA